MSHSWNCSFTRYSQQNRNFLQGITNEKSTKRRHKHIFGRQEVKYQLLNIKQSIISTYMYISFSKSFFLTSCVFSIIHPVTCLFMSEYEYRLLNTDFNFVDHYTNSGFRIQKILFNQKLEDKHLTGKYCGLVTIW